MITLDKIAVYKRYGGDIDGLARVGTAQEKQIISDADWFDIEALLQFYAFKKKGLLGDDYRCAMEIKFGETLADAVVAAELERMA